MARLISEKIQWGESCCKSSKASIIADTSGLASSRVKKAAGDTVFKEGDKGHFMYLVEDGMIEIVHN